MAEPPDDPVEVEAASRRFITEKEKSAETALPPDPVEAASRRFHGSSLEQLCAFLDPRESVEILSGNLPHWRQAGVTYFVTFRLADSLPREKLSTWAAERDEWLQRHPEPQSEVDRHEFTRLFSTRLEQWLDQGAGSCVLRLPECRDVVEQALRFFDGERYVLGEYVVAPNHVHALIQPHPGFALSAILHSWKSFTARKILETPRAVELLQPFWEARESHLSRSRRVVWQKESYDHIVRSPESLERIIAYIRSHRQQPGELPWLE
jgi:REP element-mobilizing transposase RayT